MKAKQRLERWLSGPIGWARLVLLLIAGGGAMTLLLAAIDDRIVAHQRASFVKMPCYMEESRISRGWDYVPDVLYRYEVNGQRYEGRTISSRFVPFATYAESQAFLFRFGPGADAECYVNPNDPAEAMLELPTNDQAQRLAMIGGLVLLLGLSGLGLLEVTLTIDTAPPRRAARAPGWGEIDSGPHDPLHRTRQILKERLES